MKLNFTFKHLDRSEALETYATEEINTCARFMLKDGQGTVRFFKQNHEFCVEVSVNTKEKHFRASAMHIDPYIAVDEMVEKLEKQFLKMREQVQHHKSRERSKEGRLNQMNDRLEIKAAYRKAA